MRPRTLVIISAGIAAAVGAATMLVHASRAERVRNAERLSVAHGVPGIASRFNLETADGRAVTERSFRGKWLLVYFGFTVCPEACPTALLSIGSALDTLGPKAGDVQALFITIDPQRDTPKVMGDYMKSFDPRILGLVGTPQQLAAAARNYRVYDASRSLGGGAYTIDHSSFIYVVNPSGGVAKILTGDLPGHGLAEELRRLL